MTFLGEILALTVAVLWTVSSLSSEYASRRYGSLLLNIVRMSQAILFIALALWAVTGSPLPTMATHEVWIWLALSSLAGYIVGDYFFLKCFILVGARWGELFMTIAPPAAAITGWILLGEQMSALALLGMVVTLAGISLSILSRKPESRHRLSIKLPVRGVIYGIIAGIGQGVGLVFSKQGMLLYHAAINGSMLNDQMVNSPMVNIMVPFAATMIRCLVALAGFCLMYAFSRRLGREEHGLRLILSDRRALSLATLSTITGPCIGVALSLAASMFTSTGIAQTLMSLVPILILWPSHLIFHSRITPMEIFGAIISVAGVALFFV